MASGAQRLGGPAVGIDLGTTNSVIACLSQAGLPEVIPNALGNPITPSVIFFGTEPPLIGEEAKEISAVASTDVAAFFKRSMGDTNWVLNVGGEPRTAADLSALLLRKLRCDAEAYLEQPVIYGVITVPAYFNNSQREATLQAGLNAGLEDARIINEPTAAALAYGLETVDEQVVLVYDLGGGTFDVSLVSVQKDVLEVIATDGDHNLGGKDWDDRMAAHLAQQFADIHGESPLDDDVACSDLLARAEAAKKTLSQRNSVRIPVHFAGKRETLAISREEFDELTCDLMERTQRLVEEVLHDAGLRPADVTGALLVGGSTRMPIVHRYVERMFGKQPMTGVNVDEAVALGAAIRAGIDLGSQVGRKFFLGPPKAVHDVMSHSLGMIAISEDGSRYVNCIIIPKNGSIPCEETRPFKLRTRPDYDNRCEVFITQGETEHPQSCAFLGKYEFSEIPHDPSGTAVLDIRYAYDHNGVVQVSGNDRRSGLPLSVRVGALPDDMSWVEAPPEIERLEEHTHVYLLIDTSSSMSGAPLDEAKRAASAFVGKCDLGTMSVGLISFGSSANTEVMPTQNAKRIDKAIRQLRSSGSTNMAHALQEARDYLEGCDGNRFVVLLTDGYPNSPNETEREAQRCAKADIGVIAIGTGKADLEFLRRVSSTNQDAVFSESNSLVSTFSSIAQRITEGAIRVN